jgi:hypothetical protein
MMSGEYREPAGAAESVAPTTSALISRVRTVSAMFQCRSGESAVREGMSGFDVPLVRKRRFTVLRNTVNSVVLDCGGGRRNGIFGSAAHVRAPP